MQYFSCAEIRLRLRLQFGKDLFGNKGLSGAAAILLFYNRHDFPAEFLALPVFYFRDFIKSVCAQGVLNSDNADQRVAEKNPGIDVKGTGF